MTAQNALLLTEEEWVALRDVAYAYLLSTNRISPEMPDEWKPPIEKARALCDRIMEAT